MIIMDKIELFWIENRFWIKSWPQKSKNRI